MRKAKYLPTNDNIIILNELEGHVEIFLNGQNKIVPTEDILEEEHEVASLSLEQLKKNVYLSIHDNPISDMLYSQNTSRLVPEPHQYKPLFKFLNSESNRILIADEVGLGKTIEAGMIFKEVQSREDLKISVIVVPPSLTLKWKDELALRFGEYFSVYNSKDFVRLIHEFEDYQDSKLFDKKIIISYHNLRDLRVVKAIQESNLFEVDFLIMDEAHSMRNNETSTFYSAQLITGLSKNIVFLTATPVQNKLYDLFNILSLLDKDLFMDYEYFEKQIKPNGLIHSVITMLRSNASLQDIKTLVNEILNALNDQLPQLQDVLDRIKINESLNTTDKVRFIDELGQLDHLSFIVNRTKKKDVGRLIPRSANSVVVIPTQAELDYYQAVIELTKLINPQVPAGFITIMPERMASSCMIASLNNFKTIKNSGKIYFEGVDDLDEEVNEADYTTEIQEALAEVIRIGNLIGSEDSKYKRFIEVLSDIKKQGIQQAIVFSFFKHTLNYLYRKLTASGFMVGLIHGGYSVEERYKTIQSFRLGKFDVLLSSEVGSEGLDMQFCNVIINYDLPWNPMRVEQRIGRIDRIGQKFEKLHIFNLSIAGSIEDRILSRLYEKLKIFESSIGELEPILGRLNHEIEIQKLLELTDQEIDQILHVEELSDKRREIELSSQSLEFDKLLLDDYEFDKKKVERNSNKAFILNQTKELITSFLDKNRIAHKIKDPSIVVISSDGIESLVTLLKTRISDKKRQPKSYQAERNFLGSISRLKEVEFCFDPSEESNFETVFLGIGSPFINLILKDVKITEGIGVIRHPHFKPGFAAVCRVDINSSKNISVLVTTLFDENMNFLEEVDFQDLLAQSEDLSEESPGNHDEIKSNINNYMIGRMTRFKSDFEENLLKQVDVKIKSVSQHFEKKIAKSHQFLQKVNQKDVQRMKYAEIGNLQNQLQDKIKELELSKRVSASFNIIGILKISSNA